MSTAFEYFEDSFPMLESKYPFNSYNYDPKNPSSFDCQYSASEATKVKVKSVRT